MFIDLPDAEVFATSFGSGPRTFVAHGGWVGSGELWAAPFEDLSRRWRAVTYDHRGTGATVNRAPITFDLLVQDLFRVLDHLRIERCVLAGESSGAAVVLEAALRAPERFEGLVLVDGRWRTGRTERASQLIAGCQADFPATMQAFVNACIPEADCEAHRRWALQIVMRSSGPAAADMLAAMDGVAVQDRLAALKLPTLLIHGENDRVTPLADSQELATRIEGSRLVTVPDCGHVPTITRPREVVQAIEAFFG